MTYPNPWAVVGSWDWSTNVTEVTFPGLAGYSEILVHCRLITFANSGFRTLQVSEDNGATWLTTSSDYKKLNESTAGEDGQGDMNFHVTAATAARSGVIWIPNWKATNPKVAEQRVQSSSSAFLMPSLTAFNAL